MELLVVTSAMRKTNVRIGEECGEELIGGDLCEEVTSEWEPQCHQEAGHDMMNGQM